MPNFDPKTVFGQYCYIIQGTCGYVRCEMCKELKEPDKEKNNEN